MSREAGRVGNCPAVILLRHLGAHGHMWRGAGTHRTPNRTKGDEGGEGGWIPYAGEINLGRVTQRRRRRILGQTEESFVNTTSLGLGVQRSYWFQLVSGSNLKPLKAH